MTRPRRAALEVMRGVRRGELADVVLGAVLERAPTRDRPWIQELAYGTLRLRGRLDHLLGRLVHRGLGSLRPDLLDTLRLGAYQLLEMESVPAYAAVSQTVDMARAVAGQGAARLANGVLRGLRRLLDQQEPETTRPLASYFPDPDREPREYLVTWGSHPGWLVDRWIHNFGVEGARALIAANNRRPELYLRPVGVSRGEAVARLEEAGLDAEPVDFAPDAVRLVDGGGVRAALEAVPAVVQDPAAGLVVRYAAPPRDAVVADLCAAPGGKALALAGSVAYLAAADLGFERLARLRENRTRLPGLGVGIVVADAREPPFRPIDMVLIDVPCTGTGTLRRHPDGRWRVGPSDLESLVVLQREILAAAAGIVRPGGLLLYSTCSLEPEENEDQVDAFLERHPEYSLEPPEPGVVDPALLDAAGNLVVRPQDWGVDGAFAARMRRSG